MEMELERIDGSLQENLLTLLCFDDKNCKVVRAAVTPKLFESTVYREIAGHALDFIDQYGEAIKEHLADQIEHILEGDDRRKSETYRRLLGNLFAAKDTINSDYVVQQLHKFVRQQNLKSSVIEAVDALKEGRIDEAEVALQKGLNRQSVVFEPGLSLDNEQDVATLLDNPEEEGFTLGIDELDRKGIMPRRKGLTLFLAARGMGKSWFLTHCAKRALLNGMSVAVITLEMGEKDYAVRFLQSFFSISQDEAEVRITRLTKDRDGDLSDVVQEQVLRMTLKDPDIKSKLRKRAGAEFKRRAPMRIKAFPTGSLTISELEAWLEGLERFQGFTPDVILIDYPDLMALDQNNLRIALGQVIAKIRGLAVRRNAVAVVVSQGNREAETATTVTGAMAAEDISKMATADLVFTYSQTKAEYFLGLARLGVEKARTKAGKFSVLMSQAYAIGQFCLDSVRLRKGYWDILDDNDADDGSRSSKPSRRRRDDDDDNQPRRGHKTPRRRED